MPPSRRTVARTLLLPASPPLEPERFTGVRWGRLSHDRDGARPRARVARPRPVLTFRRSAAEHRGTRWRRARPPARRTSRHRDPRRWHLRHHGSRPTPADGRGGCAGVGLRQDGGDLTDRPALRQRGSARRERGELLPRHPAPPRLDGADRAGPRLRRAKPAVRHRARGPRRQWLLLLGCDRSARRRPGGRRGRPAGVAPSARVE